MGRWVCSVCDYEYIEEAGDPAAGIPPGTRFEDLPDDWRFVRVDGSGDLEGNEDDYL